jgi:PPOX class probable F420-dependent enzyme
VSSGSCRSLDELPDVVRAAVDDARRAVLTTIDSHGRPHAVPVCFAIVGGEIVSALDQKPKSGRTLQRINNLRNNPTATVLFDRWGEDWHELAWVMVRGTARIEPPGTAGPELLGRYPQYRTSPPAGEVIVVRPAHIAYWTARPL